MAWKDNLQDAKFRDVAIEVIKIDERGGHDVARHEYPYFDGIETEDLGLKERVFEAAVVFWGDDYEGPLGRFMAALKQRGPGELVHPVWGILLVQPVDWSPVFQADDPDYCQMTVTFWETSAPRALFNAINMTVVTEKAVMSDTPVTDGATKALESRIGQLAKSGGLERIQAMRTLMNDTLSGVQSELAGAIRSATDVIDTPRGFASDLIGGLSGLLSTGSIKPGDLFSGWRGLVDDAKRLGRMPGNLFSAWNVNNSGATPAAADAQSLSRFTRAAAAASLGSAAGQVLVSEVKAPTLTPPQLETMVGDVRVEIQAAIDLLRPQADELADPAFDQALHLVTYRPVIETLKDQALTVQQAGAAVLERRPPLVTRTVPFAGNWHLLAHHWYQDYTRARELSRLNPQIRNPNQLQAGDKVSVYVK